MRDSSFNVEGYWDNRARRMFLGFFFYCVFHVASIGTVLIGESDDRYE